MSPSGVQGACKLLTKKIVIIIKTVNSILQKMGVCEWLLLFTSAGIQCMNACPGLNVFLAQRQSALGFSFLSSQTLMEYFHCCDKDVGRNCPSRLLQTGILSACNGGEPEFLMIALAFTTD